ncbi:MAG: septal ring lytic transglycosylase RlpA family protein [bacterium]|nr:septal ring lytic transglycosylase RlpA family protein [bacterium]
MNDLRHLRYFRYFTLFLAINMICCIGVAVYLNSFDFKDVVKEKSVPTKKLTRSAYLIPVRMSWYGEEFDGKPTASGEIFDMSASSVAHVSLPFGKNLRFFNPENRRWCEAEINDSGPFDPELLPDLKPHPQRQFDASKALAECLGFVRNGVIDLFVTAVSDDDPLTREEIFSDEVTKSGDRFTQSVN